MPGAGAPGAFRLPRPERRQLANGLEVWVLAQHHLPLVSVQAVVRAGGIADPAERPGLAQFTAALLDEAAAGMGPLELAMRQKALATSLVTGLDCEQASFGLTLLADHFEDGLALLSDVLLRPDLRSQDVERLRMEHLANLARKLDEPQELGDRVLRERLFGAGTPYGHPLDGTRASLEALLRDEALAFYERHYRSSGALLVIVGDVSPEEAFAAAGSAFGPWRDGEAAPPPGKEPGAGAPGLFLVDKPGAPQSYLTAVAPALSRMDPDYPAFVVFNAVLGGQFTSRINMNLREDKGYTYGARSYLESKRGVMPWVLYTSVQTDRTLESVREILADLDRILSGDPVSEQEFENARNNLVLRYPQSFETQVQLADGLSSLWVYGLPEDYHERMLAALQTLTLEEVRQAGRKHLNPERLIWVIVGDRAKVEAPVAQVGLGEPVVLDVAGMSGGRA
jgi:zinc protease